MKTPWSMLALVLSTSTALAQAPRENSAPSGVAAQPVDVSAGTVSYLDDNGGGSRFTGNRNFPNFIGYVSNPLFAIDPRAVSGLWPLFENISISTHPRLPNGDIQLYGAGLNLALTERLSVGLNQGGYAVADFHRNTIIGERGRTRDGWLNLGGFAQYTLIEDVHNQFLATAGMRWTAPSGSNDVFQGKGPVRLAAYGTLGKEFGEFHLLTTAGYDFPAGSSEVDINFFYGSVHLDRRCFCWLYPLVELNWVAHTESVGLEAFRQGGYIDFGTFSSTGNILTLAVGFNAVLVPDRLELGAVYTTPIATEREFDFSGIIVKMVYRF